MGGGQTFNFQKKNIKLVLSWDLMEENKAGNTKNVVLILNKIVLWWLYSMNSKVNWKTQSGETQVCKVFLFILYIHIYYPIIGDCQCLSALKLWVRTPFMARCTRYNITYMYMIKEKFFSDLWQISVFCWVLWFVPPIKLTSTI